MSDREPTEDLGSYFPLAGYKDGKRLPNSKTNIYDLYPTDNQFLRDLRSLPYVKKVKVNGRLPDKIAYDEFLGQETLWWVVCFYNQIIDPFNLDNKDEILIPRYSDIQSLLLKYKK